MSQNWRELYEVEADKERRRFDATSLPKLLEQVSNRQLGNYYQLWPAIAAKASLEEAGWILFDVLKGGDEYLIRFHCATALLKIAGDRLGQWSALALSGSDPLIHSNLQAVEIKLGSIVSRSDAERIRQRALQIDQEIGKSMRVPPRSLLSDVVYCFIIGVVVIASLISLCARIFH